MYWITEAETAIPLNSLMYIGRDTLCPEDVIEHGGNTPALVMTLMKPYLNCGWNLTGNNYFSDIGVVLKVDLKENYLHWYLEVQQKLPARHCQINCAS